MSPRTRATFQKLQKERARQEKQRAKAERKLQKKLENKVPEEGSDILEQQQQSDEESSQSEITPAP